MEMTKNWPIEFGDFERRVEDINFNDSCVEFPSSWPIYDTCGLSFTLPSNIIQSVKSSSPTQFEEQYEVTSKKEQPSAAKQNVAKQNVTCNGISDENVISLQKTVDYEDKCSIPCINGFDSVKDNDTKESETDLSETNKNNESSSDVATTANTKDSIEFKDLNADNALKDNCVVNVQNGNATNIDIENNVNNYDDERTKNEDVSDDKSLNTSLSPEINGNSSIEQLKPSQSSWASLFHKNSIPVSTATLATSKTASSDSHSKNECTSPANAEAAAPVDKKSDSKKSTNNKAKSTTVELVGPEDDPNALFLAEKLLNMDLIFKPQAFMPRGLINTSNWCYINATLQALLVCPPFYQLLKSLPSVSLEKRKKTCTPIIDSFVQLASEYRPLSTKRGYQSNKEVRHGPSFEPRYIYDMLALIKSSLSQRGSQEDAEEFQSCVLNGLHEEMARLFKHYNGSSNTQPTHEKEYAPEPQHNAFNDDMMNGDAKAGDEWEEVVTTKRNRSAVTQRADVSKTPISDMFRGELCTTVFRPGQKASVSYEPFFSLPLDVSSDHPWSIEDALHVLTDKENFSGTATELDAMRQQSIETLPPVLILHLKRFVYDKNGGSKKIDKRIDYHTDLVIRKELLSKQSRKLSQAQRSYKLFAVVYHHGEKATGGHYTTDVFHIGLSMWLRIDDQSINAVHHNEVTRHNANRTAYILYYRRTDLG